MTTTCGARRTASATWPAAAGGREVDRAQPVALGEQQLGGADVLADRAHVLPGRGGGPDLRHVVRPVDVLAHDDRVEAVRERVAGVDDRVARERAR